MNLPLANAPLSRAGIVFDIESLNGRELQADEIAAMRLRQYEARREALQQIANDRRMRELSLAVNQSGNGE